MSLNGGDAEGGGRAGNKFTALCPNGVSLAHSLQIWKVF